VSDFTIQNCHVYNNAENLLIAHAQHVYLLSNKINQAANNGAVITQSSEILIESTIFEANGTNGLKIEESQDLTIKNGRFIANDSDGFISSNIKKASFIACQFNNNKENGVNLTTNTSDYTFTQCEAHYNGTPASMMLYV